MKRNWINVIATILIVAGVYLLFAKKRSSTPVAGPATRAMTDDEIRNHFYASFENVLGRPLNDIEKQMITISHDGTTAHAKLSEPLLSRVAAAERQRKAAQSGETSASTLPTEPGTNPASAATMPAVSMP